MVTFLFWNLNRKPVQHLVAAIAQENYVDVLILAECEIAIATLLDVLNTNQGAKYALTFSPSTRLMIFTRFPHDSITAFRDVGGVSIRKVFPPVGIGITLVAMHLSSKLYQDTHDQALMCTRIARLIDSVEAEVGHTRTVIVGDLNMNPFEAGVSGAEAFHAVMSRTIAQKESRTVGGEMRRFFYNPMWGRFGEAASGPSGTYYYNSSKQINFFWNMFDQVLIRPSLLDRFREEDIEILTKAGSTELLSDTGVPNNSVASDHLPIMFRLNL